MNSSLDEMYRDIILEHYRYPRGKKPIDKVDVSTAGKNPSCGDEIDVELQVENDIIKNIHVDCKGCAISVASASMLAELVKDKPLDEVIENAEIVRKMLKGEEENLPEEFGDIVTLKGVRKFPVRIKCALLAWLTLLEGIKNFQNGDGRRNQIVSTEEQE